MMFGYSKRKLDEESDAKKAKAFLNAKEREEYTTSNEWPVFSHPDGGTVKITPWGSLREYVNPLTGEKQTKFEDLGFQDMDFASHLPKNSYGKMGNTNGAPAHNVYPSTPQSMCNTGNSSPAVENNTDNLRLSPGDEAEQYVLNGYEHNQYPQEQENFLGMDEHDLEYDDAVLMTYSGAAALTNDDDMMT